MVQSAAALPQMQRDGVCRYFAMASLAGLLCSIRSLLAGNAGRLVGMLSGLLGRAPPAPGASDVAGGGLTMDAESAGFAL